MTEILAAMACHHVDKKNTTVINFIRYDVWLADWRGSCVLPWTVYNDYTLDDCAKYDCCALIDKVLEITKQVSNKQKTLFNTQAMPKLKTEGICQHELRW